MRHEQVDYRNAIDIVDVAAIWPNGTALGAPLAELEDAVAWPARAVPDLPFAAGAATVAAYAGLMGAFAATMATGGPATFAIAISTFYVAIFLTVPTIFLKVERRGTQPTLSEFLADGMHTYTGHISGAAALIQMLIVPVLLTFAILAIGTIAIISA
jgi:hypothetical protein